MKEKEKEKEAAMKLPGDSLYGRLFEEFIDRTDGFSYQEVMSNKKVLQGEEDKKVMETVFKTAAKPDYLTVGAATTSDEKSFFESLPIIGIKMSSTEYDHEGNKYVISYAGCKAYIEYLEHKQLLKIREKGQK